MKKIKKYLMLFLNTLLISTFTFGGGYVIISMYRKKYVEKLRLLTDEEMMDIMTLSQSSPGPIAVNSSLLIGYKLGGVLGGIVSMLGTITPPVVILSIISMLYSNIAGNAVLESIMHGMQAGITAIICDVIVSLTIVVKKEKNFYGIITLPLTFALVFFLKINVIFVILPAFAFGIIVTLIEKKLAAIKAKKKLFDNSNVDDNIVNTINKYKNDLEKADADIDISTNSNVTENLDNNADNATSNDNTLSTMTNNDCVSKQKGDE